jgi:hypothetical protein
MTPEVSTKWICKVCGVVGFGKSVNPLGFCRLERGFPLSKPHLCPCQEYDSKGEKSSCPAIWEANTGDES